MTKSEKKREYKNQEQFRVANRKKENLIFLGIVLVFALVITLLIFTPAMPESKISKRLEGKSPEEIRMFNIIAMPVRLFSLPIILTKELITGDATEYKRLCANAIRENCLIFKHPIPNDVAQFIKQLEENESKKDIR